MLQPEKRRQAGDGASLSDRPTKRYLSLRSGGIVTVCREDVDDKLHPLPLRRERKNHSPTGFEWGYADSGPAQLALAVLADAVGAEDALFLYRRFKFEVIASLPTDRWEFGKEAVLAWYRARADSGE